MNYKDLIEKAESLKGTSRFELAEIKKSAEQRKGPLAGLSRFEVACVIDLCEKQR